MRFIVSDKLDGEEYALVVAGSREKAATKLARHLKREDMGNYTARKVLMDYNVSEARGWLAHGPISEVTLSRKNPHGILVVS